MAYVINLLVVLFFLNLSVILYGCEEDEACTAGTKDCLCGENDTCGKGLICENNLCIQKETDGDNEAEIDDDLVAVDGDGGVEVDGDNEKEVDRDDDILIDGDDEVLIEYDNDAEVENDAEAEVDEAAETVIDGDSEAELDIDGDDEMADVDAEIEDDFICSGSCDTAGAAITRCVGEDLCYCENDSWVNYDCDTVCSVTEQLSVGCGYDSSVNSDYCLCKYSADGDEEEDIEQVNPYCSGACTQGYTPECTSDNKLCMCNNTGLQLVEVDCNAYCVEYGYDGSDECAFDSVTKGSYCACYERECETNNQCLEKGKDLCMALGASTYCVDECAMNTCSDSIGCMDIGLGDDCGVCWDPNNMSDCYYGGDPCGSGSTCSTVCGLWEYVPKCVETCVAAPNTCASDETCMPLQDENGLVVTGYCFAWNDFDCDTCGEQKKDRSGD